MLVSEGGSRKPPAAVVASGNALNTLVSPKPAPTPARGRAPGVAQIVRNREKAATKSGAEHRQQKLLTPDPEAVQVANSGLSGFDLQAKIRTLTDRGGDRGAQSAFTFASMGVPISEIVSPRTLDRLKTEIGSWTRQNLDLSLVPPIQTLRPDQRQAALDTLKAAGRKSDAGMSDLEIVREMQRPSDGTFLTDVGGRLLPDLGKNLAGIPMGVVTLGYAAGRAVRGDTDPAKAVAGSAVDWYKGFAEDPIGTTRREPASVALNVLFPAKGVAGHGITAAGARGVFGAAAKETFNTPRGALDLPNIGARIPADQRASFSPDAINRLGQNLNDRRIAASTGASEKALAKAVRRRDDMFRTQGYRSRDEALAPLNDVNATQNEKLAAWAMAQDVKPSELASYYEQRAFDPANLNDARELRGQAKLWANVARDTNDGAVEGAHSALDAARSASTAREATLTEHGVLDPQTAAARKTITRDEVLGAQGITRDPITDPFFVKHTPKGRGFSGFLQPRTAKPLRGLEKETQYKNELALIKAGRANPEWRTFAESVARVPTLEARLFSLRDFLERHGSPAKPGEGYDPEKLVALKVDADFGNATVVKPDALRPALAAQLREQRLGNKAEAAAGDAQLEQDLLRETLQAKGNPGEVPADGQYLLVPKSGWDAITKPRRGESFVNTKVGRNLEMLTGAWRFATLGLRLGYILPNTVGVFAQGLLGGTGPASFWRAARGKYNDVVPEGLKHQTFAGNMSKVTHAGRFGEGRLVGGVRDVFQTPLTGPGRANLVDSAARALPRGAYLAASKGGHAVIDTVSKFDAFVRKAQYLHDAIPAARKSAAGQEAATLMTELERGKQRYDTGNGSVGADWAVPVAEKLERILGRFDKGTNRTLNTMIPFYGWYGFITKQVLFDLPVHHPVRAALLNQIGQLGNEARQQMGVEQIDAEGAIPTNVRNEGDRTKADMLRVSGLNPWDTVNSLVPSDMANSQIDYRAMLAGPINPAVRAAANTWMGRDIESRMPLRDSEGRSLDQSGFTPAPLQGLGDIGRTYVNQFLSQVPVVSLATPARGRTNENIPIIDDLLGRNVSAPPAKSERQPERTFAQRAFGYGTGLNFVTKDLNLAQRQALAHLEIPNGASPDLVALIKQIKGDAAQSLKLDQGSPSMTTSGPSRPSKPKRPSKPRRPSRG